MIFLILALVLFLLGYQTIALILAIIGVILLVSSRS